MTIRRRFPRGQQLLAGVIVALAAAQWRGWLGAAVLIVAIVIMYRALLLDVAAGLRFDPWWILTTPVLMIGLAICGAVLLLALFPAAFAPFAPNEQAPVLMEIDGQLRAAPFPPSAQFVLGTDPARHDLLSRIMYGTRNTLVIALSVVGLRLVLGGCLGWLAGWYGGEWGNYALIAALVSGTIPSLLFAWIMIVAIGPGAGLVVFVLGLGLTGWAHWTQLLDDEIRRIRIQPYMEAAEAVGIPPNLQFSRYVLPNILPVVLATAAHEVAAAMLLLAELGFLGIFYGNGVVIRPAELQQAAYTGEFRDWAGMLAGTRFEIFQYWWLPLAPAGAFFITILGFNLLAEGLRDLLDTRNRRPPSFGRRFVSRLARRKWRLSRSR